MARPGVSPWPPCGACGHSREAVGHASPGPRLPWPTPWPPTLSPRKSHPHRLSPCACSEEVI